MMKHLLAIVCLLFLCVVSVLPLSAWPQYTTIDLRPLTGDTSSEARSINWFGQIAGSSSRTGRWTPVIWDRAGHVTPLPMTAGYPSGLAYDINNYGEVAGVLRDAVHRDFAVLWRPDGTLIELGTLPGDISSSAESINDLGQVVGYSVSEDQYRHAFIWDVTRGMTPLCSLPDELWNEAFCINNAGQAGGMYVSETRFPYGVLWHDAHSAEVLPLPDADYGSRVSGINDIGQATGLLYSGRFVMSAVPVVWEEGTLQRLPCYGAIGGSANAINNVGEVVGDITFPQLPSKPPFFRYDSPILWSASPFGYTGYQLGMSGTAYDINDLGEIVGGRNVQPYPYKQPPIPIRISIWRGMLLQPVARTVTLDIKPGEYPNSINLRSNGVVPVAIICTPDFDPRTVNPDTIVLAGARPIRCRRSDVDRDGDADLLLFFRTQDLHLLALSEEATLVGRTVNDSYIRGIDYVRMVRNRK